MATKDSKNCVDCTLCAGMPCWHQRGYYHVVRWVLAFVILAIVFGFGVKIGEFKNSIENGSTYSRHMNDYYGGGYSNGMIDRNYSNRVYLNRPNMMDDALVVPTETTPDTNVVEGN